MYKDNQHSNIFLDIRKNINKEIKEFGTYIDKYKNFEYYCEKNEGECTNIVNCGC